MIKPIQSLRAFAVIVVLLFHLNIATFNRGYLGVDIFFTVSGFVIYISYINKINNGREILNFLKSRFFRLFPAYLVTSILTITFGIFFLLPQDMESIIVDGIFSIIGIINIYYLLTTNYFSIDADYRPFLHFWSLAVEQQYYIMFSLYTFGLIRLNRIFSNKITNNKNISLLLLLAISIFSFILSFFARKIYLPADFFNPFTRAWQFGIGMIFAQLTKNSSNFSLRFNYKLILLGFYAALLLMFFVTMHGIFKNIIFDQLILACSVAIICYISSTSIKKSWVDGFIIQWIGKISYSLYLVHWPLIVFYQFTINRAFDPIEMIALTIVTFVLSAVLHYKVEVPWKSWPPRTFWRRLGWLTAALSMAALSGVLATKSLFNPADHNFRVAARQNAGIRANIDDYCVRRPAKFNHGIVCDIIVKQGAPTITIMGDSHVVPLVPALTRQAKYNITIYVQTGCLPLKGIIYKSYDQRVLCDRFFDAALNEQQAEQPLILVARWNGYFELVASKQNIVDALDRTVNGTRAKIAIVQQPYEFDQLLPFAVAYARSTDVIGSIKPRQGFFPDGFPHVSAGALRTPKIIETRKTLCALSEKKRTTTNACFFSPDRGLFYADDNHLLPSIAAQLKIVP